MHRDHTEELHDIQLHHWLQSSPQQTDSQTKHYNGIILRQTAIMGTPTPTTEGQNRKSGPWRSQVLFCSSDKLCFTPAEATNVSTLIHTTKTNKNKSGQKIKEWWSNSVNTKPPHPSLQQWRVRWKPQKTVEKWVTRYGARAKVSLILCLRQ